MKPAWDQLMAEYKGDGIIADVDCTVEQDLCSKQGVQGYPTIKYGPTSNMVDYSGGRDFDAMLEFANTNLGPSCDAGENKKLCTAEESAKIDELVALSVEDLEKKVEEGDKGLADAEQLFKDEVQKLQTRYESLEKEKEAALKEIKGSGLGTTTMVLAQKKKDGGEKGEL